MALVFNNFFTGNSFSIWKLSELVIVLELLTLLFPFISFWVVIGFKNGV